MGGKSLTKTKEHLSWFGEHLQDLSHVDQAINVVVCITDQDPASAGCQDIPEFSSFSQLKHMPEMRETEPLLNRAAHKDNEPALKRAVVYGKLDAKAVVRKALLGNGAHNSVYIGTCGPKSLMDTVINSVDDCRSETSRQVDIHCENFGI